MAKNEAFEAFHGCTEKEFAARLHQEKMEKQAQLINLMKEVGSIELVLEAAYLASEEIANAAPSDSEYGEWGYKVTEKIGDLWRETDDQEWRQSRTHTADGHRLAED